MYLKIKEYIIAAGIVIVILTLAGCISNDSGGLKTIEIEPENISSKTGPENTSNFTAANAGQVSDEEKEKAANKTEEQVLVEKNVTKKENLTEIKPVPEEKPYGEDAKYISYDPVMIYGSMPESKEIKYIKEDKVVFKFLYYSRCPVCNGAKPYVPVIKEEFGERVIVEEMEIYDKSEEKWKNAAKDQAGAERFPFTLSIGMNSLVDDKIRLELISYTEGFSAETYGQWRKNICSQFRDKPKNCE